MGHRPEQQESGGEEELPGGGGEGFLCLFCGEVVVWTEVGDFNVMGWMECK